MTGDHIDRVRFNSLASHPLQSFEWGEFREKTGIKVIRKITSENQALQLTIHPVPYTNFFVGYFPKGDAPTQIAIDELKHIGKEENCAYIQLEPNIEVYAWKNTARATQELSPSFHPLFTRYTFVLDLTPSEDDLLKNMHHKTRYNIKVAQKNGVIVRKDDSEKPLKST